MVPRKLACFVFAAVVATTTATVHVAAHAAPQTMLTPYAPITIACPPEVKANTHPARDLPGWTQVIANAWLHGARYDKGRHIVECTYGSFPNPQYVVAYTTLRQAVDQALVNCHVTEDQKAVACDSNAPNTQNPTSFRKMR